MEEVLGSGCLPFCLRWEEEGEEEEEIYGRRRKMAGGGLGGEQVALTISYMENMLCYHGRRWEGGRNTRRRAILGRREHGREENMIRYLENMPQNNIGYVSAGLGGGGGGGDAS